MRSAGSARRAFTSGFQSQGLNMKRTSLLISPTIFRPESTGRLRSRLFQTLNIKKPRATVFTLATTNTSMVSAPTTATSNEFLTSRFVPCPDVEAVQPNHRHQRVQTKQVRILSRFTFVNLIRRAIPNSAAPGFNHWFLESWRSYDERPTVQRDRLSNLCYRILDDSQCMKSSPILPFCLTCIRWTYSELMHHQRECILNPSMR